MLMLTTLAPMTPVHAASIAHQTMTANAMAPFNGPRRYMMERNNRSAIPDFPNKVAIRTKLGMAMRILLVVESKARPKNIYQPSGPQPTRAKIVPSPASIKATG